MKTYLGACAAGSLALAVIVSGARPLPALAPASAAAAEEPIPQRPMARHGSTLWLLRAMSAEACVATLTTVPQCSTAPALNL
jgi:hypothetical protein